jgi:hypothetical protein
LPNMYFVNIVFIILGLFLIVCSFIMRNQYKGDTEKEALAKRLLLMGIGAIAYGGISYMMGHDVTFGRKHGGW